MSSRETLVALGRPAVYYPRLRSICGSLNAAVILSNLIYWTPRSRNEEGWIYKSHKDWTLETGLTRDEQDTARAKLREKGLIEEATHQEKGAPTKHYRVVWERLDQGCNALLDREEKADRMRAGAQSDPDPLRPTAQTDCGPGHNGLRPTAQSLHTESTTKSTTESTLPQPTARRSDPLWDALVDVTGYQPTPKQRGAWNLARKEIADLGGTPEEVYRRAPRYLAKFDSATLTPPALAKWWNALDVDPPVRPSGNGKTLDPTKPISTAQAAAIARRQQAGLIPLEAPREGDQTGDHRGHTQPGRPLPPPGPGGARL